jgi:hypothetical protein
MSKRKIIYKSIDQFDGKLADNNIYEFPKLNYLTKLNQKRYWGIKAGMLRSKEDWSITPEGIVTFKFLPLDYNKPYVGVYWSKYGIDNGKVTTSIPTFINKGKNLNKINETSIFLQTLMSANIKYLKKVDEYKSVRYLPLALHKYAESDMKYPVYVQPKLDGTRALSYMDKNSKVVIYSRRGKDITELNYLRSEIKSLILKLKSLSNVNWYLDGEMYKDGESLQTINGFISQEIDSKRFSKYGDLRIMLNVFDMFSDENPKEPYSKRLALLSSAFKSGSYKYITLVNTTLVHNKEENDKLYKSFLKKGLEGSVIRKINFLYKISKKEIRTKDVVKRKPRLSGEFKVVGYKEGLKGKDKGAIIWILETSKGLKFTSQPAGISYEERYRIFKSLNQKKFDETYKNKWMTIDYDSLSKDGIPLKGKSKGLRDKFD